MARQRSTKQRRAKARNGTHRRGGTALNVYTAVWLTRRFMRAARSEARRTLKGMRRSRSRRAGWRFG